MRYLELDRLAVNPALARHLPPELAFQYHALSVADLEDGIARAAVCQAVGRTPYLVKGDARAISKLLAQMWPEQSSRPPHFLVLDPPHQDIDVSYAGTLSEWLGALLERKRSDSTFKPSDYDLIIMNKAERPTLYKMLTELKLKEHHPPTSLLIVQKPVWPLTRLLLVLRCNETSDASLNWIIKLAKHTKLDLTIQIITPPLPTIHYDSYIRALMSTNTEVGSWIHRVGRQFEQWQIPSTVKIRQGDPIWQLKQELAEGEYNLAVIAHRQTFAQRQWLLRDELITSLLNYAGCPILIAQRQEHTS